jgi:hypothetical protein
MKKTIPVSQIASMIYQTKKNSSASTSSFDSREEWKKAMKQAWKTVHSTLESRQEVRKEAWNKQESKRIKIVKAASASAITKAHMDKMAISEEGKERANAEAIYADYEKKWKSKITKRLQ